MLIQKCIGRMRVAVIGAGAAGLAALRHLTARDEKFEAVAFEQTGNVGGTWVYTDRVHRDEQGLPVHASMYKNLKTNLPKEVMAFPDFPFNADLNSFMTHFEVREYLDAYTDKFDIRKFIQFHTVVERVHPRETPGGEIQWEVDVRGVGENKEAAPMHMTFDAVMVCNGHYFLPLVPEFPGGSDFKGQIIHSHDYRSPEDFAGKHVFCLGAGASGQDITLDLATQAKHVYLGHKNARLASPLPENMEQTSSLAEITPEGWLMLEDGRKLEVDVIMLCTGYHYKFPFLTPDCAVSTTNERVTPLYKHIIHTTLPSLSVVGLCKTVCPFPQFDCQVRFILAALDGSMKLPSTKEMDADTEEDLNWRLSKGMPVRHAHHMGTLQWGYNDQLANLAHFEPIPRVVRTLYDHVHDIRVTQLPTYKKLNYKLVNGTTFAIA